MNLCLCREQNKSPAFYRRNQQYSITAITDGGGGISERYAYSAYGTTTILDASLSPLATSAVGNRYMYTGREWDEALALYHYRARMYDSVTGRFVSRDPIGFDSFDYSHYRFCRATPLSSVDPSGHKCRALVIMGHNTTEIMPWLHTKNPKFQECDYFGAVCCFPTDTMKRCDKFLGGGRIIPGFYMPSDKSFGCDGDATKGIPSIVEQIEDAFDAATSHAYEECHENSDSPCDCKERKVTFVCGEDMNNCAERKVKSFDLSKNPCGKTYTVNCKTKEMTEAKHEVILTDVDPLTLPL